MELCRVAQLRAPSIGTEIQTRMNRSTDALGIVRNTE